jgi:D-proline reductase (dithiol) PrdB
MTQRTLIERISQRIYSIPAVAQLWARLAARRTRNGSATIPWTPPRRPLRASRVALVTTGGVHLPDQPPFDMDNPDGDATFRPIPATIDLAHLVITHKYYDHRNAGRDPNIIFPLDHLHDLARRGIIGGVAARHFGFMGHIDGPVIEHLTTRSAPEVARSLLADGVNVVVLTPA